MEQQRVYELSLRLNQVLNQAKNLMDLDAFRYAHFVHNSPRGHECTYAKICLREHNLDPGPVYESIDDLYELITTLKEEHGSPRPQNPGIS